MLNDYIKKLIFILLSVVTIYIIILIFPYATTIFKFIVKMLIPFIIAFAIAFILQPLVRFFQDKGLSRSLSVIVVLVLFVIIIVFIFKTTVPYLIKEIKTLIIRIPDITADLKDILDNFAQRFNYLPDGYKPNFDNISNFLSTYIIQLGNFPKAFFDKIFSYLSIMILVPMILIYFLLDYEKILCVFRNLLIKYNKIRFKEYLADLNKIMGSYFRGVFIVMIIVWIMFTIAFSLLKLDFAFFFAFIIAITNIIPYLGSYIGGAFPFLYALIDSPQKAIIVIIICFVLQTVESDIITPYIQSKQLKIHPLVVILGLLVFGYLFGIIGMMVAVPILSIIKITLKHYPIMKSPNC